MASISRRLFLQGAGGFAWATAGLGSYAFAFEPGLRLNITSYRVTPPHWPDGMALKAAVLADIHACEPWMPASRVRGIANLTNDLGFPALSIVIKMARCNNRPVVKISDAPGKTLTENPVYMAYLRQVFGM